MDVSRRNLVAEVGAGGLAMWATPLHARIGFGAGAKGFAIARGGQVAPIMVDPGDFPGVRRAALDLSRDIGRVSGVEAGSDRDLLSLALDMGFASKASFNRAFKARFGVSPSQFRRQVSDPAFFQPEANMRRAEL